MIETTISLPPPILQYLSKTLLYIPTAKFCDDCETLDKIYTWLKKELGYKFNSKCFELEKEFLELYGRTITKEKELKEKTGRPIFRPLYYFKGPNRNYKTVLGRVRRRALYHK